MKKVFIQSLAVTALVLFAPNVTVALADADTVAPIVSIGVGNGNEPANAAPEHGKTYGGGIAVYATVNDDNLENYHFRVVKVGGSEGHTCTDSEALFAAGNQGHASSTLSKDACGFAFNSSVYAASGFTNQLIATVNAIDLAAFAGEGEYWFILGARDMAGNRSAADYLNDPRVKVVIDLSASSTETTVTGPSNAGTGTALSGSRRRVVSSESGASSASGSTTVTAVATAGVGSAKPSTTSGSSVSGTSTSATSTDEQAATSTEVAVGGEANAAAVGLANLPWNYVWIVLLVLLLIALGFYLYKERNA